MKKKILLFFVFLGIVQMGHAQKFDLELGISKGRTRHEHRPFILNGGINFSVDWFVFYSGVSFNYSSTYNHDPLLPFEEYYSYLSVNNQFVLRSEEHTSELQSRGHLVCRLLLEKKNI